MGARRLTAGVLPPDRPATRAISVGWRALAEPALVVALVGLGAAIRWIDLWTIPIFTDEGDEIGLALRIVRDGARPLTNDDPYLGPLFNYLLAAAFWLAGPDPWLPRAVMLVLGALTLAPTYLLARELALGAGARPEQAMLAGALAGGLLALNAAHVLVTSHVAWGNCLTPLLTTTAGWLLARATRAEPAGADRAASGTDGVRRAEGLALALAGGVFGLALQTHPSVAVLLPGAAVYVLWSGRRWLRTPWPYLGAAALVAAQAPTLLHIRLVGPGAWLDAIREKQEMYERDGALSLGELGQRLGQAVHTLGVALGGQLNDRDTPLPPLWHPAVVLGLALALLALVWLIRRRQLLAPLVAVSGLLLLPLVNGKYAPLVSNSRYLMPVTIVLLAAVAGWAAGRLGPARRGGRTPAVSLIDAARGETSSSPSVPAWRGSRVAERIERAPSAVWRSLLPLAAVVVLLVVSGVGLLTFSAQAHRDGRTNARLLASLRALEAAYQPGQVVSVDRAMYRDWTLTEGRLQRVFASWLEARGIAHRVVDLEEAGRPGSDLAARGGLAVLARRSLPAVARSYQVEEIASDAAPGAPPGSGYTLVRLRR